jgi:hypothetical protein
VVQKDTVKKLIVLTMGAKSDFLHLCLLRFIDKNSFENSDDISAYLENTLKMNENVSLLAIDVCINHQIELFGSMIMDLSGTSNSDVVKEHIRRHFIRMVNEGRGEILYLDPEHLLSYIDKYCLNEIHFQRSAEVISELLLRCDFGKNRKLIKKLIKSGCDLSLSFCMRILSEINLLDEYSQMQVLRIGISLNESSFIEKAISLINDDIVKIDHDILLLLHKARPCSLNRPYRFLELL